MQRTKKITAVAAFVATLGLLAGCSDAGAPTGEDLEQVTVSTPSPSPLPWIAYYIAGPLGFYEEEGLSVEVVGSVPNRSSVQALDNGTVDFAGVDISTGLPVIGQNDDLTWIGFSDSWPFHISVLEDSPIETYEDLAGKHLAIRDDVDVDLAGMMLASSDLEEGDVQFDRLGEGATLATALVQGSVDAMFGSPFNEAFVEAQTGESVRRLPSEDFDRFVNSGFMTHREDMDTAVRVARAVAKAWVWAVANPESAIALLAEVQPAAVSDPASALDTLTLLIDTYENQLEKEWAVDEEALAIQIATLFPEGDLEVSDVFDEDARAQVWSFDVDAVREAAENDDPSAALGANQE